MAPACQLLVIDASLGQLILSQANLDEDMNDLLAKISLTYLFLVKKETLDAIDIMKENVAQISQVVQQCAQFTANYSETKKFCMRLHSYLHVHF